MTIRAEIKHLAKPINDFAGHPRNVRQGDIGAISVSLEAHGQYKPILVQKSTNFIIAGNHTWQAAKQLGWPEIAVQYLDIDDDKALRILLADNRATDLASYDDRALAEVLSEFARGYDMGGLLWDQDDLDDLLRREHANFTNMAVPFLNGMPTDQAANPLQESGAHATDTPLLKTASFFYTEDEFNELKVALERTEISNRNDALLKVVREWSEAKTE